jgi:glycosyltransferase involved in cell wall biosynthesis
VKLSVVIPTYKRPESLERLLRSLDAQSLKPDEVLLVSGDEHSIAEDNLIEVIPEINLKFFYTRPSVCVQRNMGIKEAKGTYVALFDDDIELESGYLEKLVKYLEQNQEAKVASGLFLEKRNGQWTAEFPPKSVWSLLYKRIFNHAIWGSINDLEPSAINKVIYSHIRDYYNKKGNDLSSAGWPLVTDLSQTVNPCEIYTLGASVFRRDVIKSHPFDEVLEPSGIGDNYGVALSLNQNKAIMVLNSTYVHHHRESANRMAKSKSYVLRILAMDYFLKKNKRKSPYTHLLLIWSLMGNLIAQILKLELLMVFATLKVTLYLLLGINPYHAK